MSENVQTIFSEDDGRVIRGRRYDPEAVARYERAYNTPHAEQGGGSATIHAILDLINKPYGGLRKASNAIGDVAEKGGDLLGDVVEEEIQYNLADDPDDMLLKAMLGATKATRGVGKASRVMLLDNPMFDATQSVLDAIANAGHENQNVRYAMSQSEKEDEKEAKIFGGEAREEKPNPIIEAIRNVMGAWEAEKENRRRIGARTQELYNRPK